MRYILLPITFIIVLIITYLFFIPSSHNLINKESKNTNSTIINETSRFNTNPIFQSNIPEINTKKIVLKSIVIILFVPLLLFVYLFFALHLSVKKINQIKTVIEENKLVNVSQNIFHHKTRLRLTAPPFSIPIYLKKVNQIILEDDEHKKYYMTTNSEEFELIYKCLLVARKKI